jgi:sialate O-acetylesterase
MGAVLALVWMVVPAARAEVKPHPLFSDGMVLQQGKDCPIWGTADPGEEFSVILDLGGGKVGSGGIRADQDGNWRYNLNKVKAGGPYTLHIGKVTIKDVYVGEVWVCSGQSNMEWPLARTANAKEAIANSANPSLHLFTVQKTPSEKPLRDVKGKWSPCNPDTVKNFSAVAYYFGRDLQKALNVPVGLIHTSWGGTRAEAWTSRAVLESHPEWQGEFAAYEREKANYPQALEKYKEAAAKAKAEGKPPPRAPGKPPHANSPSALYNGMIAPLIPYAIRGAIWYQGESNAGKAYEYRKLFPVMIQNWRDDWKQGDFPFLFVQLAPFQAIVSEPQESAWAELREAQLLTSQNLKNTGMAVITDVGDPKDIHPQQKEPVGGRLALAAQALAYGQPTEYSGPIYESLKVDGNKAVLHFKHIGKGLEAKGDKLTGFTVAGEDHKFHNARAVIVGDTVVVWSDAVEKPVAVRYGWANCPVVNLWNRDGLPASPFRTDDFPMVTGPKKSRETRFSGGSQNRVVLCSAPAAWGNRR